MPNFIIFLNKICSIWICINSDCAQESYVSEMRNARWLLLFSFSVLFCNLIWLSYYCLPPIATVTQHTGCNFLLTLIYSNNNSKTVDIPLIPGIARVVEVRLLGVILTSSLSWSCQVDSILVAASQRLYLLNQLRHISLDIVGLSNVFRSLVVSKMLYALPAIWPISGSLNQSDINRLDALLRKAKRWGLTDMTETFGDLSDNADERLFRSLQFNSEHCLAQLLPALNRKDRYTLRHITKF